VERGLTDYPYIVIEWLKRTDIAWTQAQIQRGLRHEKQEIREAWEQMLKEQHNQKTDALDISFIII